MKKVLIGVGSLLGIVVLAIAGYAGWQFWKAAQAGGDPAYFESSIVAFEEADAEAMPPPGGILFVGSSSIRMWDTLAEDMAPLPVIRRGFGGAHMEHVIHNARRIVTPYDPRAIVVFVGGNDINAGKSVAQVAADYRTFLALVRAELGAVDVWILSMKPSKLRWSRWPRAQGLDVEFRAMAAADPNLRFVGTGRTALNPDGTPDDVYKFDGLHLNAEGYRRWTAMLKPLLMEAYGG